MTELKDSLFNSLRFFPLAVLYSLILFLSEHRDALKHILSILTFAIFITNLFLMHINNVVSCNEYKIFLEKKSTDQNYKKYNLVQPQPRLSFHFKFFALLLILSSFKYVIRFADSNVLNLQNTSIIIISILSMLASILCLLKSSYEF